MLTSNAGSENSVNPNDNSQSVTVCLIQLNDARRRRDRFVSDVSYADYIAADSLANAGHLCQFTSLRNISSMGKLFTGHFPSF